MKKLALAFVALGLLSAPVFACPGQDKGTSDTPKVAEKEKKAPVKKAPAKKAPAKKDEGKKTDSTVAKK